MLLHVECICMSLTHRICGMRFSSAMSDMYLVVIDGWAKTVKRAAVCRDEEKGAERRGWVSRVVSYHAAAMRAVLQGWHAQRRQRGMHTPPLFSTTFCVFFLTLDSVLLLPSLFQDPRIRRSRIRGLQCFTNEVDVAKDFFPGKADQEAGKKLVVQTCTFLVFILLLLAPA